MSTIEMDMTKIETAMTKIETAMTKKLKRCLWENTCK